MSDTSGGFLSQPARVVLDAAEDGEAASRREARLIVKGQGTVRFALSRRTRFEVGIVAELPGAPGLRWIVEDGEIALKVWIGSDWQTLSPRWIEQHWMPDIGVDRDPACTYWFSVDSYNGMIRYGKGEMRLETALAEFAIPGTLKWMREISLIEIEAPVDGEVEIWRDPIAWETPMRVVSPDSVTMDDVARKTDRVAVPANLSPACQQLYQNVTGASFVLDTPDFPNFSEAIRYSIETKGLWCHTTLEHKAREFGEYNPKATYLRITLGGNQGESPGIPFVMEIWPSGNYSPIHNHGSADAVIKVLHGEITVHLFAMLSHEHQTPFGTQSFHKDEVTWISARLNQFHKLENRAFDPCITIQCYQYAATNDVHWPYFDYLETFDLGHFDPNRDADFLEFKEIIRAEWEARPDKPAPKPEPADPEEAIPAE